jgi:hypothetical protein
MLGIPAQAAVGACRLVGIWICRLIHLHRWNVLGALPGRAKGLPPLGMAQIEPLEMKHDKHGCVCLLSAGAIVLWASVAMPAPPPGANASCAASYREAEQHVAAGRLRRAREVFTGCAKSSCGALLSQQCRSGLLQLDEDTPSIVPTVSDASGELVVDVRVSMDGELLTSKIDGRSLAVDPGVHELSFVPEHGSAHHQRLLVIQGQRNRVIAVQLQAGAPQPQPSAAAAEGAAGTAPSAAALATTAPEAPRPASFGPAKPPESPPASPEESAKGPPVLAYVVGGAGLVAVGGAFLLAHWGSEDNLKLDRCAPNCTQASIDHVSHMYVAADITLGVGVVALGTATYLYLMRPDARDRTTDEAFRFDVKPIASGAFATVGRAF